MHTKPGLALKLNVTDFDTNQCSHVLCTMHEMFFSVGPLIHASASDP